MVDAVQNTMWAQLLPTGPEVRARDGRRWTYSPIEVIAAFVANKGPLAVDYEHAQDRLSGKGEIAPAAGWITNMEERGGALWAQIEWTDKAARWIAEKAYRYLSPSMCHSVDRRIIGLAGAGLVNRPALYLPPLEFAANEQETANAAVALARRAQEYQDEMLALGRQISISEAVTTVATHADSGFH